MEKRFVIIMAVIILGFFGFVLFKKTSDTDTGSNAATSSGGSQNYYGNLDSEVTVTEFVDFQCEACYAYYPYVKELKEKYKDQVRFQVRNFPITSGHKFAFMAARSAEAAAKQGKFWEMHDKLFEGQKVWEQMQSPQSVFESYAQEIGLDMEKFRTDRDSSEVAAIINQDLKDVKELGGTGTPTFAINGKMIERTIPNLEALSKVVDDALAEAGKN